MPGLHFGLFACQPVTIPHPCHYTVTLSFHTSQWAKLFPAPGPLQMLYSLSRKPLPHALQKASASIFAVVSRESPPAPPRGPLHSVLPFLGSWHSILAGGPPLGLPCATYSTILFISSWSFIYPCLGGQGGRELQRFFTRLQQPDCHVLNVWPWEKVNWPFWTSLSTS